MRWRGLKMEIKLSDFIDETPDIQSLDDKLAIARVDPNEDIEPPRIAWEIKNKAGDFDILGTCGNFSAIIGKAKSRKSFLISIAVSSATKNGLVLDLIRSDISHQPEVLYFDTEQSKYHVQLALKRICKQIDINNPQNLTVYGLRKYEPKERLALIEHAIYNMVNVGFVVIDGIKDLITSINDEEQATMITSKLLKWTEERNIHIVTVLHQNKSDLNARGHVGTELINKAETILSVTKADGDNDISIVEPQQCRNKEPESFAFEIIDGLPVLADNWEVRTATKTNKIDVSIINDDLLYKLLAEVFTNGEYFAYSELLIQLKIAISKEMGKPFGDNKIKELITKSKNAGYIIQKSIKGKYTLAPKPLRGGNDINFNSIGLV